jgi:site-specific recombinase XerD
MARGRFAPRAQLEDCLEVGVAVVSGRPDAEAFLEQIVRELRIRFYQPTTIRNYRRALRCFLRWLGAPPHRATREDVREYLLYLVDAGASCSWVAIHLAAIRTSFDKMCGRSITLGLASPRRPQRLPVVLSTQEVSRVLQAAPTLRDKLLLGLMYATGMRVSEVVRLRYRDVDIDRRLINVWQGKGRVDRQVMLPKTFEPLLQQAAKNFAAQDFLFPASRPGRHLSARTAQRAMQRAVEMAAIGKRATPHTLRHSFACHTFENGCDIRYIQKLLGHVRLETTTLYVKVAKPTDGCGVKSPLDLLADNSKPPAAAQPALPGQPVGNLQIHLQPPPAGEDAATSVSRRAKVTLAIDGGGRPIYLTGIVAQEVRPGWVTLEVPPLEQWEESLRWLTPLQRERVASPGFFRLLQQEIPHRLRQLPPPPGG